MLTWIENGAQVEQLLLYISISTFNFFASAFLLTAEYSILMRQLKEYLPSTSIHSRKTSKEPKPSTPYDQIPVFLQFRQIRPFSQILHNQEYCLARKQKVREITSHTVQRYFQTTHHLAKDRERQLLKKFKVRCKRKEQPTTIEANQQFFTQLMRVRQTEQIKLNGQYLAVVRQEMQGRNRQSQDDFQSREKRICEYNIMYDYRSELLPNPFKRK